MVNPAAQSAVQASLHAATDPSSSSPTVPGLVCVAVDRQGNHLAAAAAGKRSAEPGAGDVDLETSFWLASCTKLLTSIACMQGVERGVLSLDESAALYEAVPELKEMGVWDGKGFVPKEREMTLRMLLSHTAGFGYEFFDPRLRDYPGGIDVFHPSEEGIKRSPLVNQPGTVFEYGTSLDWAGLYLERASATKLDSWIQTNIVQPLNLTHLTFTPTPAMKANMATLSQRPPNSPTVHPRPHLYAEPLTATPPEAQSHFHSGGAGAFARPTDYCAVLATLLNSGTSPTTSAQILSPPTVDTMFTNQIPSQPDFGRAGRGAPSAMPELSNALDDMYPQAGDPPQGWGLCSMLTLEPGETGRAGGTGCWAGIANLFWWCDRVRGVAGMVAGQILPFGDAVVMGQYAACEAAVYKALDS